MSKIKIGAGDALTIVDMQNDFCHQTGALYVVGVAGEGEMFDVIRNNLRLSWLPFTHKALTVDEHPAQEKGVPDHIEFATYGPHVIVGSYGAKVIESFYSIGTGHKYDEILRKGEDRNLVSFSAAVGKTFPKHIALLREKKIKRVFVSGVAFTHCAGETAISYAVQGFDVYVVRDATRSVPPPFGNPVVMTQKLLLYGVKIVYTADLF